MGLVTLEILNNRKEKTRHCVSKRDSEKLQDGEYKLISYVWIINDKNQVFLKQRSGYLKNNPNCWETIYGTVSVEDDISINTVMRLLKDMNIKITKENVEYIGCYKRISDFIDVWLVKTNFEKKNVVVKANKVQDVDWFDVSKVESMVKSGLASKVSFDIFKKYYKNFYNNY